jgi:hypothetical protein
MSNHPCGDFVKLRFRHEYAAVMSHAKEYAAAMSQTKSCHAFAAIWRAQSRIMQICSYLLE